MFSVFIDSFISYFGMGLIFLFLCRKDDIMILFLRNRKKYFVFIRIGNMYGSRKSLILWVEKKIDLKCILNVNIKV